MRAGCTAAPPLHPGIPGSAGRYAGRVPAAPVKVDDELELRVDSLAYGGNGVARLNGFVVFVGAASPATRFARA